MSETASLFRAAMPAETAQPYALAALMGVLAIGVIFAPAAPFIIDGGIYYDMARAMAENGSLAIAGNGGVEGAPALTKFLTREMNGLVYPQYPSGYALIAAPFYKLFGIRGLMLMNALGMLASILLIRRITQLLFGDRTIAMTAAVVFSLATFAPTYAFGIWPHMLSLSMLLGAVACAIEASKTENGRTRSVLFLAAGLLIGIGANIRVDAILTFPILFVWLKLFARPGDRLSPLWLVAGLAPGLLLAAYLNFQKFGVFNPFSYGSSGNMSSASYYAPLIAAGAGGMIAMWLFDLQRAAVFFTRKFGLRSVIAVTAAVIIAAMLILHDFIGKTLYGFYVLVFNLEAHDAYHQAGVEPDAYGHLLFWGYPKRAFIQSLPFLPLILTPVLGVFRGKHVPETALCLLAIAAPVFFYSMNQWHGGGSYNMRYFIPALPFVAMLSAVTVTQLAKESGGFKREAILIALVAALASYLLLQELGRNVPALFAPAALYPQWLLAIAVLLSLGLWLFKPALSRARIAMGFSLLALAYGAALNSSEEIGHEKTRAEQLAMARDISAPIESGSLVVTALPIMLIPAEQNGAAVMVVTEDNSEQAAAAVRAFTAAGRCIYFHNSLARDRVAQALSPNAIDQRPIWAASERFSGDPRLAFFTLSLQSQRCAF